MNNITLTWVTPTTRGVGASALAAAQIDSYKLYWDQGAGGAFFLHHQHPAASGNTTTLSSVGSGTYKFKISTVDTNGQEGPMSPVITAVVNSLPALPDPPTGFTATVS